jgi:hypothetical protein
MRRTQDANNDIKNSLTRLGKPRARIGTLFKKPIIICIIFAVITTLLFFVIFRTSSTPEIHTEPVFAKDPVPVLQQPNTLNDKLNQNPEPIAEQKSITTTTNQPAKTVVIGIVDEHNQALQFWADFYKQSEKKSLPLVHIDAHSDGNFDIIDINFHSVSSSH